MISDYENDYLEYTINLVQDKIFWTLSPSACQYIREQHTNWTYDLLRERYFLAVKRLASKLGSNIVLCLSGGIDSQSAALSLIEAKIPFTPVIVKYEDNLNSMDVDNAILFCEINKLEYKIFDIEVIEFLTKKLKVYVDKYKLSSPQISTHFYFIEKIIHTLNPSAIAFGGAGCIIKDNKVIFSVTHCQNQWRYFKQINQVNLVYDFLSHSLDMFLFLALCSRDYNHYMAKVEQRQYAEFPIIEQESNFTGFENIKKKFANLSNDDWTFEKLFRFPYERIYPNPKGELLLPNDVENIILTNRFK